MDDMARGVFLSIIDFGMNTADLILKPLSCSLLITALLFLGCGGLRALELLHTHVIVCGR